MTLTSVVTNPALILVDLQRGITGSGHLDLAGVLQNSAHLADRFRQLGHPVVLVTVSGGAPGRTEANRNRTGAPHRPDGWDEVVPELGSHPSDIRITKRTWGAFHNTDLDQALRARGVTQVFIGGVATSMGVESTARAAHEHGYHVALVTDAMLDPDARNHRHSIDRIFPRLGETVDTAEVIAAFEKRDD
jgi:nicotinamidase-related amidase